MDPNSAHLTLTTSETASLLDVHPSTVKRWCNDGDLASMKTDGGHRRIPLEDAVAFAAARGMHTVLSPFHPYEPHVWTALQDIRQNASFKRLETLAMGWIARGQLRRLGDLFDALAHDPGVDICALCDEGIRGVMHGVGQEWARGRLRAGEEHMVSQVMVEVLLKLRSDEGFRTAAGLDEDRPVAVVGTLEGNHHHLGSLCVRLLLESLGWQVHYLGPDVPVEDFGVIQRGRRASLVCISLPPAAPGGELARAVRLLTELYEQSAPYALAFGGGSIRAADEALLRGPFTDVRAFESCRTFQTALEAGLGQPARTAGRSA
jgi:excisionase family DNA binding protein